MRQCLPCLLAACMTMIAPLSIDAAENCDTALGRIARKAAERAISEHQENACSGLKLGPIGYDVTKRLVLRGFQLCEDGAVVKTSISIEAKCATGDKAMISDSIEDNITATASADLASCQIIDTHIDGDNKFVQAGLNVGRVAQKLREAAQKEISPYCK